MSNNEKQACNIEKHNSYEHLQRACGVTGVRNNSDTQVDSIDHRELVRIIAVTKILQHNDV